jgi:hypothetical protein
MDGGLRIHSYMYLCWYQLNCTRAPQTLPFIVCTELYILECHRSFAPFIHIFNVSPDFWHRNGSLGILYSKWWVYVNYRIAGNFCGVQFLWFSWISSYPRKLDPWNKYDCTVYDRSHPRKLNFEDWPSAKIGPHEIYFPALKAKISA